MIKFVPVIADEKNQKFENHQYLPFIISLFAQYKNILIDDYYPKDKVDLLLYLIDEINSLHPWFLLCLMDNEPIGVVWATHWHGNGKKYHSCQIHSYVDKKYWGTPLKKATDALLDLLFINYGLERVQMEIPENNHKAVAFAHKTGFTREGVVRCASIKDGKPLNNILFSKLKGEHFNG